MIQDSRNYVSASTGSRHRMKAVRLLYLAEDLPAEVQKLISKKLKEVQKLENPLLLEILENMLECEGDFINMDTVFSCVLVYLYVESLKGTFDKDLKQKACMVMKHVLEKEPDNLIALSLNEELNTRSKERRSKEKIKTLLGSELHLNGAFAVIAFYLYKLNMIQAAIALFEQAIKVWEQKGKGQEIKVAMWKYLLAGAYTQFLNNDMFSKDKDFDPDKTMARIKELLRSGIDLGTDHSVLAARCYTDLALAFSKYRLIGIPHERYISTDFAPKECYEKAWNLCDGSDPHVMEKYAIFIRKTATNTESLQNAARIFEKLLRLCPLRHVAAHHLALTYKFLWFDEERLAQRYLYQNRVKAGKVSKAQGESKNKRRREKRAKNVQQQQQVAPEDECMNESISCESTSTTDNDGAVVGRDIITEGAGKAAENAGPVGGQDIEETAGNTPHEKGTIVESQMDCSPQAQCTEIHTSPMDTDRPEQLRETDLQAVKQYHEKNISVDEVIDAMEHTMSRNIEERTSSFIQSKHQEKRKGTRKNKPYTPDQPIHPNWPQDHKKVPDHRNKRPDYYDRLRAENPITKKSNARYLGLTKHYLEKANKSAKKLRVLYLVDLARVSISCGDNEAARGYFDNAKNALSASSGRTSHRDTAYLYEQWALMLAKEHDENNPVSASDMSDADGSDVQTDRLNKLESYFLKSIRSSIRIKSKSRVAYYRLTEMLEKPTASDKWKVLYEVYQLVGQDTKASDLLKDKDKTKPQVRALFKKECLQSKNYEKYLDLAHSIHDKSPDNSLQNDIVEMTLLKQRSMSESASSDETELKKTYADYGEAMKLCLKRPHSSDEASTSDTQPQRKQHEPDMQDGDAQVFIARNDYTDTGVFAYIYELLTKMEGITVKQYFPNAAGDLPFGCDTSEQVGELVEQSDLILVSDYHCTCENGSLNFKQIVPYANQPQVKRRVFIIEETGEPLPKAWRIFGLPHKDVRRLNETNYHDFLTEVLGEILEIDFSHCKKGPEC